MRFNPDIHHRRSIRLKGYDYTQPGAYYVTIATAQRECLFGGVINQAMIENALGAVVERHWRGLPHHYRNARLDAFIVMPNHLHGIIWLEEMPGHKPARRPLPEIVRGFKTWSARRINEARDSAGTAVWQRDYYEHIVRDENDLNRIRQYIADNPARWEEDAENPANWPSPT